MVHSKMTKPTVTKMVDMFMSKAANSPRFLVGTTQNLGKGLDLYVADILVQWEVEWLIRDEFQAVGRVDREGLQNLIQYYRFLCTNFNTEVITANRHKMRDEILERVKTGEEKADDSDEEEEDREAAV